MLEDTEARLSEVDIDDEEVLYCNQPIIRQYDDAVIRLKVKDTSMQEVRVGVPNLDITLSEFKMRAKDQVNIAPVYQRYSLRGQGLNDDTKTLREIGV